MIPTARESEGQSAVRVTSESPNATDALLGADGHAIPPPIVRTPERMRHSTAMKKTSQAERTDTRRSASRLEPCDSRIINAGATTGSWRIWLVDFTTSRCEKRATQSYSRNAQTASLTPCSAFPNQSTELVPPPLPTHTNLQPRHLRRRSRGARKTQHQHRPHLLLPSIQAVPPPFSVSVPSLGLALSATPKTTKFASAPLRMNMSNRDEPPSSTTGSTYRTDNRSPSTAPSED